MADHLPMAQPPTTPDTQPAPIVPLRSTLAAAAEVQRLDVEAMHEKVRSIHAVITASPETLSKKHVVQFYDNITKTDPKNAQQMRGNCMCCSKL
eukprot:5533998-Prymnesium_polylepis.1